MRLADDKGGDTATTAAEKLFIPENPLAKNIQSKIMDEESADIIFEVESTNFGRKRSKTTTIIHALILQQFSSTLDEICKPGEDQVIRYKRGDGMTTISITDVDPKVFKHVMFSCTVERYQMRI